MKKQKQKSTRPGLLLRICAIHLILLITFGLSAEFIAERHWLTVLFAYAPPILWMVPTLLLLPFALWKRDRYSLILLGTALLPLPFLLGCHIALPTPNQVNLLRVLTYNIEHASRGTGVIASAIRESRAEIICLQEVNGFKRMPDPVPGLRKALPGYHVVRAGEVAIATTLPLKNIRSFPLSDSRVALLGEVEWQGKSVTIAAVHLSTLVGNSAGNETLQNVKGFRFGRYLHRTADARMEQVQRLLVKLEQVKGPLLVCGDFNTPPRGLVYRQLTNVFEDTFATVGTGVGWTFPARFPVLRIDYIFTRGLKPYRARVLPHRASDHRPFLATLRW